MSQYKLIGKYMPDLRMFPINWKENLTYSDHGIKASDLEKALESGMVLYGDRMTDQDNIYTARKEERDRSFGLLIGKQPLEKPKPVSKEEIVSLLKNYKISDILEFRDLLKRIETNGIEG